MDAVFVYGTLRSGSLRNPSMTHTNRKTGTWSIPARMYDIGTFPAVVLDPRHEVVGEVYELSQEHHDEVLERLDLIEGVEGGLYRRVEVIATAEDGRWIKCYTYVAGESLQVENYPEIPSGDWHKNGYE